MKKFYRHAIAAPLLMVGTLLLCFSSCMSSDNIEEGALVVSLPLTTELEGISSRVGMSDAYDGIFTCYWNCDKLDVYHKYLFNGVAQSMMPLEFNTSAMSGTTATFFYTGSSEYRYDPNSRIYAFSKGTSGGYTPIVAEDGTSTLTAPTLASQNGTLSDCAACDALYGCADLDYTTILPRSLGMHHLFGLLHFHLTSSTFSTNFPVLVTLTSSAANILPGNNGSATLKADGTLGTLTGSWNTSWSATITPNSNGVVDIYFMTWPFSAIDGTFTVSCSDDTGYLYKDAIVTLSGSSLSAAQRLFKSLPIVNILSTNDTYSNLYAWDASDFQPVKIGTVPTNANTTTLASAGNDYSSRAIYVCKNCPNGYEITWYLNVDCYWDDGTIIGGNKTSYKIADGSYTRAGLWLRKKSGIPGFSSTTISPISFPWYRTPVTLTAALASSLNLNTDYFFLPANGISNYSSGAFSLGGSEGYYWSSAPEQDSSLAYGLYFRKDIAGLNYVGYRTFGMALWKGQ